jgi:hypothetical protein
VITRVRLILLAALTSSLGACGSDELFTSALSRDQLPLQREASARITSGERGLGDVVVVGDLDGDGSADAILNLDGEVGNSGLRVLYGGAALSGDNDFAKLPGLVGEFSPAHALLRVTPGGDVNGDGLADFLVADMPYLVCSDEDPPDEILHSGVHVVLGSAARFTGVTKLSEVSVLISDSVACSVAGAIVANLGDIDGDGLDDVAIGRNGFWGSWEADGLVQLYVFYGRSDHRAGTTIDVRGAADAVITLFKGDAESAYYAQAFAGPAGDVDGDGFADWVITVPRGDGRLSEVRVVRGGPVRRTGPLQVDDLAGTSVSGTDLCTERSAAPLGDLDGDGADDIAIYTCSHAFILPPQTRPDQLHVLYGRKGGLPAQLDLGAASAVLNAGNPRPRLSWILHSVGAGDVDGDGLRDIVMGDPGLNEGDGGLHVIRGDGDRLTGEVDLDKVPTYVGRSFRKPCDFDGNCILRERVGWLTTLGDVTGDGRVDVLAGAPTDIYGLETPGSQNIGFSTIYLLSPGE